MDRGEEANGEQKRKGNRWWGKRRSNRSFTGAEFPIRFGTYNISNGRNGGLDSALRGMAKDNMDLGTFQDTKFTDRIYTRDSAGYCIVATDAPSRHHGGVAILYRPSPLFAMEAVRQFGPNVVSFQLAKGARRWYIIGCYLTPDNTLTIESVVTALKESPKVTALVVARDLNTALDDLENDRRGTEIAAALTEAGLKDKTAHFLPRRRRWGQ